MKLRPENLRPEFFSSLNFTTAMINHIFITFSAVQIYDLSYIYSVEFFTIYGFITNSQNDQLPVGSIAKLVEHRTVIADVMGSNPIQA